MTAAFHSITIFQYINMRNPTGFHGKSSSNRITQRHHNFNVLNGHGTVGTIKPHTPGRICRTSVASGGVGSDEQLNSGIGYGGPPARLTQAIHERHKAMTTTRTGIIVPISFGSNWLREAHRDQPNGKQPIPLTLSKYPTLFTELRIEFRMSFTVQCSTSY